MITYFVHTIRLFKWINPDNLAKKLKFPTFVCQAYNSIDLRFMHSLNETKLIKSFIMVLLNKFTIYLKLS